MDCQRFTIKGQVVDADDPRLQNALAGIYDTPERPRCLCVPGGIEMYVARHRQFVVKRMPDSGSAHHPGCPSYEPEVQQSGLGELVGEAILELEPGRVELRVDFPWTRRMGHGVPGGEPQAVSEVEVPGRRMSLRALMHFLFERAGTAKYGRNGHCNLPIQSKQCLIIGRPSFKRSLRTQRLSKGHCFQLGNPIELTAYGRPSGANAIDCPAFLPLRKS